MTVINQIRDSQQFLHYSTVLPARAAVNTAGCISFLGAAAITYYGALYLTACMYTMVTCAKCISLMASHKMATAATVSTVGASTLLDPKKTNRYFNSGMSTLSSATARMTTAAGSAAFSLGQNGARSLINAVSVDAQTKEIDTGKGYLNPNESTYVDIMGVD